MRSQTFLYKNSISNNFYLKLFSMRCVFFAASRSKLYLLSHFCILLFFKEDNISISLVLFRGEIDICARGLFCMKFNFEQLLFKAFLMRCVFLAVSSPKLDLPRFCILLFFKEENFSIPQIHWGGGEERIDICARGLFCTKFNFEQLLFKAFSDAMSIFGSVEP